MSPREHVTTSYISTTHTDAPLSHQTSLAKHKHKVLKNFKTVTAEHSNNHVVLLSAGLVWPNKVAPLGVTKKTPHPECVYNTTVKEVRAQDKCTHLELGKAMCV